MRSWGYARNLPKRLVKTFISFSGSKSKETADALEDFLLKVALNVKIVRAERDIALGQDWAEAIKAYLADIDLAIICVTRDNHEKPWFLFEIGTLAQRAPIVVLFLLDLAANDLRAPLSDFQTIIPTRDSTWELVRGVSGVPDSSPLQSDLHEQFHEKWEDFYARLEAIRKAPGNPLGLVTVFRDARSIEVHVPHLSGSFTQAHLHPTAAKELVVSNTDGLTQTEAKLRISSEQAFERINAAVRQNLDQLQANFSQAREDSKQFFRLTIIFTSLGFVVMLVGVILLLLGESTAGVVASLASVIPEATAALFFTKDAELRRTIETYHRHILQSQQMLTMIDVCETITDSQERDRMKQQIIFKSLDITYPDQVTPT